MTQEIKAVVDAFDADDRFAPFTPERAQYDAMYRKTLEEMVVYPAATDNSSSQQSFSQVYVYTFSADS
jgi:hypothetical protein